MPKSGIKFGRKRGILKTDLKTAELLNTFFGNMVENLEINQCSNFDPVINQSEGSNFGSYSKIQRPPKHSCNSKQM